MIRSSLVLLAILLLAPLSAAEAVEAPATGAPPVAALDTARCASPFAAPAVADGTPEPLWLEHCNATQSCPSGGQVSCQGHSSCTVGSDWVTCDGVTHQCTLCGEPPNCLDPDGYCACRDSGGGLMCYGVYCRNCWPLHPECA